MKNILLITMLLQLFIMPSLAFSDIIGITSGLQSILSEGVITLFAGTSMYLFGCDLEWKLNKNR